MKARIPLDLYWHHFRCVILMLWKHLSIARICRALTLFYSEINIERGLCSGGVIQGEPSINEKEVLKLIEKKLNVFSI